MSEFRIQSHTSVVVSKFATFRYRSPSELRNQNDTRNQYVASVLSIPKFAKRRYRDVSNFGIGTLAVALLPSAQARRHRSRKGPEGSSRRLSKRRQSARWL